MYYFEGIQEQSIGSGWQMGRQSEGKVCVWVCVQGLKPHNQECMAVKCLPEHVPKMS